ncbi:MAG: alpha/beta hydrolase [Spirochaetota bacterium]|nr:alpha/beta hydrolase [Spirochaetota bacterium]
MLIETNGVETNYELTGNGACLVLIHGFSDNLNMWYHQVPALAENYRVLTYDVRGFGKTKTEAASYSMDIFADDLYELLMALNIKSVCVLGYSMGGRIGLKFTLKHPELTRGLIFANSVVGGSRTAEMEDRAKLMMDILEKGDNKAISEMMAVGSFSPDYKERKPSEFKKYMEIKMQNDPSSYPAVMQAMFSEFEATPDLSQLKCPVLIIAGENDAFMEVSIAESMKRDINDSELKILPTGHAAAIEAPDLFNGLVFEFVERL